MNYFSKAIYDNDLWDLMRYKSYQHRFITGTPKRADNKLMKCWYISSKGNAELIEDSFLFFFDPLSKLFDVQFLGVFHNHNGTYVGDYIASHFAYKYKTYIDVNHIYETSLIKTFEEVEDDLREEEDRLLYTGCTSFIINFAFEDEKEYMYMAWLGDISMVKFKNGKFEQVVIDHRTIRDKYLDNAIKCGLPTEDGLIDGRYDYGSSFGDFMYKQDTDFKSLDDFPGMTSFSYDPSCEFYLIYTAGLEECISWAKLEEWMDEFMFESYADLELIPGLFTGFCQRGVEDFKLCFKSMTMMLIKRKGIDERVLELTRLV